MNKIYTALMMFAISGLLFANIPVPGDAAVNLDYMLGIAENAKKWCKSEIEARESVDPKILEPFLKQVGFKSINRWTEGKSYQLETAIFKNIPNF